MFGEASWRRWDHPPWGGLKPLFPAHPISSRAGNCSGIIPFGGILTPLLPQDQDPALFIFSRLLSVLPHVFPLLQPRYPWPLRFWRLYRNRNPAIPWAAAAPEGLRALCPPHSGIPPGIHSPRVPGSLPVSALVFWLLIYPGQVPEQR